MLNRLWIYGVVGFLIQAAVLMAAVSGAQAASPKEVRVIFYDPDANHQSIIQITAWFNRFLKKIDGSLSFQPLQTREAFEAMLDDENVGFAIVSSAYLREAATKQLQPLLVPANDGDLYYRKVLLDRGEGTAGDLTGRNIAATVTNADKRAGSKSVLNQLSNNGIQVTSAMVIPVSKDIDALLALAFGQVQAALVTPRSLMVLKRLNPAAASKFRQVYQTPKILRSPLAALGNNVSESLKTKVVSAFLEMARDENGRRAMNILAFNSWQPYNQGMLQK